MAKIHSESYAPAKNHFFFINPISFGSRDAIEAFIASVDRAFAGKPGHRYSAVVSRFPRDAFVVVRRAAENRERDGEGLRVYAVGGDGILFDCINAAADLKNVEFANIPYGGHYDFIRTFGADAAPLFRDIASIAAAPSIPTDLICVNGNYAINYCTLGLESRAHERMLAARRVLPKPFRRVRGFEFAMYPFYTLTHLLNKNITHQHYSVTIDGMDYSGDYCSISIANGPCYGGSRYVCINAVPNDGLLNATLYRSLAPRKLFGEIVGIGTTSIDSGRVRNNDYAVRRACSRMAIASDDPLLLCLDGELFFETEFNAEATPNAVRIIAPAPLQYEEKRLHV